MAFEASAWVQAGREYEAFEASAWVQAGREYDSVYESQDQHGI